jgi:nicotinate phosphoribosyltransferase
MPEGTVFFANEPVLRVTAPLPVAQLVESRILNLIHFESVIASKAARCVLAAGGRRLVDFGMRRAHGAEAALLASRATWLAGFDATATVEAARRFAIPASGTMAHSFIQAHTSELDAFRHFLAVRPGPTTLLIDTYDTLAGARVVVELLRELKRSGAEHRVAAVRIDSGDLAADAIAVRRIFDAAGFPKVGIVLSSGLDEYSIAGLLARGAPVDAFGIGTRLDVAEDAPSLDMAYKLQAYAGRATRKRSVGKATLPGCKQVHRRCGGDGRFAGDTIHLSAEAGDGEALLVPVLRAGVAVAALPTLADARERARRQLAALPEGLRALAPAPPYPVEVSAGIQELIRTLDAGR